MGQKQQRGRDGNARALAALRSEIRQLRKAIEGLQKRTPRQRDREVARGIEALSLRQVDAVLHARKGTAKGLIHRGELVAKLIAGRLRVARVDLDRYLASGPPLGKRSAALALGGKLSTAGQRNAAGIRALK